MLPEENSHDSPHERNGLRRRRDSPFSGITVEPIAFMFMISYGLQQAPINGMWIDKICLVELNLTHEICDNVTQTKYENHIEILNARYVMISSFIELIPAIVYSVFLAAWSDKYGRKFQIIASLIGCLIFHVGLIINDVYMEVTPPYAALLMFIPKGFLGGMIAIFTGMISYISDITDEGNRLFRLMILEFSILIGTPIGVYLGGFLFGVSGYILPHALSAALMLMSMLYTFIRIDNNSNADITYNAAAGWRDKAKDFFILTNMKNCLSVALKKRNGNQRMRIWVMYLAMSFFTFPYIGNNSILYLFTRKLLDWSPVQFSVFSAISMAIGVVGTAFLLFLTKSGWFAVEHISFDAIMGMCCATIRLIAEMVTAFSNHGWMLYLGAVFTFPSSGVTLPIRSILTKSVEFNESGQVITVLSIFENVTAMITGFIYPNVYAATLNTFPGTPFLVSAAALVIVIAAFWYDHILSNKKQVFKK